MALDATKSQIENAVLDMSHKIENVEGSSVVIYYSGHGATFNSDPLIPIN